MRLLPPIVLALAWPLSVVACDCVNVKSFCEQAPDSGTKSLAIFAGTVTEHYPPIDASQSAAQIEATLRRWRNALTEAEFQDAWKNRSYPQDGPRLFRLRVSEVFQGPAVAEIVMAGGWSDCDFPFQVGGTYLVAAKQTAPSRWRTSICSQSRLMADGLGDVRALRAWKAGKRLDPLVYGRVLDDTRRAGAYGSRPKPMAGVRVRLDAGGEVRNAVTDSTGSYVFESVKPGAFALSADLQPSGIERVRVTGPLFGPNCRQENLILSEIQSVEGRVVERAAGVSAIEVQLIPVSGGAVWPRDIAMAAPDGRFALSSLEPGGYVLQSRVWHPGDAGAAAPLYYPGVAEQRAAEVLQVKRGEVLRLPDWILTGAQPGKR